MRHGRLRLMAVMGLILLFGLGVMIYRWPTSESLQELGELPSEEKSFFWILSLMRVAFGKISVWHLARRVAWNGARRGLYAIFSLLSAFVSAVWIQGFLLGALLGVEEA